MPIKITFVAMMLIGFAGPGHAEDGKVDGLAEACRNIRDGEMERMAAKFRKMSREELWPIMMAELEADNKNFAKLSEREQEALRLEWHEITVRMPAAVLSFCDYFARGALPDVGTGEGHGSFAFGREFLLDKDGKKENIESEPGARDCEKPYSATLELDGRRTKHIFCETTSGFALTSSYRPDGADGWTKIE